MDKPHRFRRTLLRHLRHLLDVAGFAALLAPVLYGAACGGKVVVDRDTMGDGGNAGEGGASGSPSGATGGDCELTSTGSSGKDYQVTECIAEVDGKCPNQYQATMYITPSVACSYVVSVDCGPVAQGGSCCYLVTEQGGACN